MVSIRKNSKKEAFYLCNKCGRVYKMTGLTKNIPNYIIEEGASGYFLAEFVIRCPKCGNSCLAEIDPSIIREIVMMNRKGYKTFFSCEGHYEIDGIDFYVLFGIKQKDAKIVEEIIRSSLPECWLLEHVEDMSNRKWKKFSLRVDMSIWYEGLKYLNDEKTQFEFTSMISEEAFKLYKKKFLKDFKEIVKSLPVLHDDEVDTSFNPIEIKVKVV